MKQNLDFTEIKEFCDKVGLNCQIIDEGVIITKPKDIWEGVEFAEFIDTNLKGKIYKIHSIGSVIIYLDRHYKFGKTYVKCYKEMVKPSTESAYVEQLKKEAFDKLGPNLNSSKIDDSNMNGGRINYVYREEDSFKYRKDTDTLYWCGIPIYQSGKWATRVKERVEVIDVKMSQITNTFRVEFDLNTEKEIPSQELSYFLKTKLEKYLNNEIE